MSEGGGETHRRDDARAMDLFMAGLEHPDNERLAWLRQQCGEDAGLFARVQALLEADSTQANFLEHTAGPDAAGVAAGERLGPYEITGLLASGGMSLVYRARRADGAYDQDVAVKLFRIDLLSQQAMLRFETERQILASLAHPNIARIIDGGTTAKGVPYVVMELVEGQTITEFADSKGLGVEDRLRLVQQVCDALSAALERGVVHRDIKPGNVLVDAAGNVKLIDFGIAKVLPSDASGGEAPLTRIDALMFTPEYASPEQVRGEAVGATSDVYSLGVLLYQLLSGERPYEVDALTPAGIETIVCNTVPPSPSQRAGERSKGGPDNRSLKKTLRGDLDKIVMTALRKEPERRYRSAAALSRDIQRHLAGQPVEARGASTAYRMAKFVKRHPGATVSTAAALLILVAALVVVSYQAVEARRQADRAEAATAFLVDMIGQSDPYVNAGTQTLASALQEAVPRIDERFSGQPLVEADLRYAVGYALYGQGELELSRVQLEKARDAYRISGDKVEEARTLNVLAGVAWDESEMELAERLYLETLALVPQDGTAESNRVRFQTLSDYGGLLPLVEKPQEALRVLDEAQALMDAHPDMGVSLLSEAVFWNNRAVVYDGLEQYDLAIAAYETSIEKHNQENPEGSPDLGTALANVALTYELVGDMDKAVEYLGRSVEVQRRALGGDHPQFTLALYNYGSMLLNAGQPELAVENLQAAVDGASQAFDANHLYVGRFNHRLGEAYRAVDQPELARQYLGVAEAVYRQRDDVPERWIEAVSEALEDLESS